MLRPIQPGAENDGGEGGGGSGLEIRPKIDVLEEMELPVSPGRDRSTDIEKGRVGRKKRKRSAASKAWEEKR